MGERHYFVLVGVLALWICGAAPTDAAPRHKRQTQEFTAWFLRQFPWYGSQMAISPTISTNQNPFRTNQRPMLTNQGPLLTSNNNNFRHLQTVPGTNQQSTVNNQWSTPYRSNVRGPVNAPVRAYNMPGVSVRGPLFNQRFGPSGPGFNNRGPLVGSVPMNNRAVPLVDPPDPPDMVNGVPVTEPPELPEPPDPTDPPDVTEPPEFPVPAAAPPPRSTIPLTTMAPILASARNTSPPAEQVTPWPTVQNAFDSSVGTPIRQAVPTRPAIPIRQAIPTQPVLKTQASEFQQAPPYIPTQPATAPPPTPSSETINQQPANVSGQTAPTRQTAGRQTSASPVQQGAAPSPLQTTNLAPKPTAPLAAAPTAGTRQSSWVMGANFNNMSPWRRMMWNRYILSNM